MPLMGGQLFMGSGMQPSIYPAFPPIDLYILKGGSTGIGQGQVKDIPAATVISETGTAKAAPLDIEGIVKKYWWAILIGGLVLFS